MLTRESTEQTTSRTELRLRPPGCPAEKRRVMVWVGKSVVFKGELVSSEDMSIDGRVEGTVDVRDHMLTIGPDAEIHANISAKTITIHGAVTGSIKASEKSTSGTLEGGRQHHGASRCDGRGRRTAWPHRHVERTRPGPSPHRRRLAA